MDFDGDGRAECWFLMLKHVWYVTSFILRNNNQNGIDVVLTCSYFSIYVIRLCLGGMRGTDAYLYF